MRISGNPKKISGFDKQGEPIFLQQDSRIIKENDEYFSAKLPHKITICMLSHIPSLDSWYRERLEILKICLASLEENTAQEYDLYLLSNGSCEEVVDYFRQLSQEKKIDCLMISKENVGVLGGWNLLLNVAPGEYIAFLNDDIFFHDGWLDECLKIIDNFPDVGFVSAFPIRSSYKTSTSSSSLSLLNNPDIEITRGKWDEQWDEIIAESIGRDVNSFGASGDANDIPLLTCNEVNAFPFASHFCILMKKEIVKPLLPFPWTKRAMGGQESDPDSLINVFDKVINDKGLAKLSANGLYAEHLGNRLSTRAKFLVQKYDIDLSDTKVSIDSISDNISFFDKIMIYFFKVPFLRKVPQFTIQFMDNIVLKKSLYNSRRKK